MCAPPLGPLCLAVLLIPRAFAGGCIVFSGAGVRWEQGRRGTDGTQARVFPGRGGVGGSEAAAQGAAPSGAHSAPAPCGFLHSGTYGPGQWGVGLALWGWGSRPVVPHAGSLSQKRVVRESGRTAALGGQLSPSAGQVPVGVWPWRAQNQGSSA